MQNCPKMIIITYSPVNISSFYLPRNGICRCKPISITKPTPTPTPKPPKQCKELEGTFCRYDDVCGVGGYCDLPW